MRINRKLRIGLSIGISVLVAGLLFLLPARVSVTGSGEISVSNSIAYASPGVVYVRVVEGAIDGTVLTLSNIEVSAGTDRVLVVGLAYRDGSVLVPTSILFNTNEAFDVELSAADGGDAQCFLYHLVAPTETTANVVITMPDGVRMVGYVAYFTGVDQTNPFTAETNENMGTNDAPTVDVNSAVDEIVVDIMAQVSAGPDTISSNSGTLICNGAVTGGGSDCRGGGQYQTGEAVTTMLYGMSDSDNWNIVAGALQEPTGATPNYVGGVQAPTNLILTYVSDYEVRVEWTKGTGAENTMVRASVGRLPESRTDGYQVYYGTGTEVTDYENNLDTTDARVYYRAFSEDDVGGWETTGISDFIEGVGMRLIALIALPIGLMVLGYVFKRIGLSFAAVGAWILLAVYSYGVSTQAWDLYYGIFFLGIGMAMVSAVEAMAIRGTREEPEEETSIDRVIAQRTKHRVKMEKYRDALEGPPSRRRGRRGSEEERSARLV